MLNTLRRRLPLVEVLLAPSPVQGIEAPPALVKAIQSLNVQSPDVILLARGGGSIEDLWAFNEEVVARAIAASKVPVISAVGHETDFTIVDFVADSVAESEWNETNIKARALLRAPAFTIAAGGIARWKDSGKRATSVSASRKPCQHRARLTLTEVCGRATSSRQRARPAG